MSDQSTPETDKSERMAYAQEYMVPTEFARRLERERDEAREALRTIAEHGENEIQKLIKERDEAREMVSELKRIGSDYCDEQLRLVFENRRLNQEHDEARNKMADAIQEVDLRTLDYLRLREAIIATLEENRHLADGDDCTLTKLKSVVPDWK